MKPADLDLHFFHPCNKSIFVISKHTSYGPQGEKTCLQWFANNTHTDQPAHPCSLISAFVICYMESIVCKLVTGEISIFWLVSVAEETVLILALTETPKTGFLAWRPI